MSRSAFIHAGLVAATALHVFYVYFVDEPPASACTFDPEFLSLGVYYDPYADRFLHADAAQESRANYCPPLSGFDYK